MIDVIDASSTAGALRAAEEVGWSRGIGAALDILTAAAKTATPVEMAVIHELALRFAQCSAQQIEALQAMQVGVATMVAKGVA